MSNGRRVRYTLKNLARRAARLAAARAELPDPRYKRTKHVPAPLIIPSMRDNVTSIEVVRLREIGKHSRSLPVRRAG